MLCAVADRLKGREKANCFVCDNPVKDGKLTGGLFLEPDGVSSMDGLSRKRDEVFTEIVNEELPYLILFLGLIQDVFCSQLPAPGLDGSLRDGIFRGHLGNALTGEQCRHNGCFDLWFVRFAAGHMNSPDNTTKPDDLTPLPVRRALPLAYSVMAILRHRSPIVPPAGQAVALATRRTDHNLPAVLVNTNTGGVNLELGECVVGVVGKDLLAPGTPAANQWSNCGWCWHSIPPHSKNGRLYGRCRIVRESSSGGSIHMLEFSHSILEFTANIRPTRLLMISTSPSLGTKHGI